MKINKNQLKNLIWIIPAIIAFVLILIPTLKYQWPLSWDAIYQVQYAQVYAKYGFVLINPLLNAPTGQSISYPPLFDFLIAYLGIISKVNLFQIARFLQPFLAMFMILSVSYVSRKFYGTIAGVATGFLIISSLLLGNRIIFPLPENLALIFFP
jgi:asparagine N-glycosylation enzyme membrane subunit Stt3